MQQQTELQLSILEIAVLLIVVIAVVAATVALWRNAEGSQRAVGVAVILIVGPIVAIIAIVSYAMNHP
jgi:multisubunit Na+/H+ antiporter MnhG subunit